MKRKLWFVSAAILAGAIAVPALAQERPVRMDPDITPAEVANFDKFLDNHPDIAKELQANPVLVNDEEFREHHPRLREFFQNHPGVREELHEHPGQFMWREGHYEWLEEHHARPKIAYPALTSMDEYLDRHPEAAAQLRQNPTLINDREFMEQHPELHEFLNQHPNARAEFKAHPYKFMHREKKYEKHEGPQS